MTALLLLVGLAHADTLRITGNQAETTFACEGRDITVEGNKLAITLTGDCGLVKAVGNDNVITVDGVKAVETVGNHNTVRWARNLGTGKKPAATKMGVGNKVVKQ